jgi:hypothetical protein
VLVYGYDFVSQKLHTGSAIIGQKLVLPNLIRNVLETGEYYIYEKKFE